MKTAFLLFLFGCLFTTACHKPEPVTEPLVNVDSIRCVQAWQQFQLPKDTILTLRYQQSVRLINGKDTMAITVIDVDDFCSEESAKDTYGCEARLKLRIQLNGGCIYQNNFSLTIGRYSAIGYTVTFRDTNCIVGESNIIMRGPSPILSFYNSSVIFRQLLPFAKTQADLQQLFSKKGNYAILLTLQKRCI